MGFCTIIHVLLCSLFYFVPKPGLMFCLCILVYFLCVLWFIRESDNVSFLRVPPRSFIAFLFRSRDLSLYTILMVVSQDMFYPCILRVHGKVYVTIPYIFCVYWFVLICFNVRSRVLSCIFCVRFSCFFCVRSRVLILYFFCSHVRSRVLFLYIDLFLCQLYYRPIMPVRSSQYHRETVMY